MSATRVIVAEDDPALRALVSGALRDVGYAVEEASNGLELLAAVRAPGGTPRADDPPDLVVSDVRMPVMSGLAVLAWLRHDDWTTPVLLLTAFSDLATRLEAARLGAAVMDKPFELAALRAAVLRMAGPP